MFRRINPFLEGVKSLFNEKILRNKPRCRSDLGNCNMFFYFKITMDVEIILLFHIINSIT